MELLFSQIIDDENLVTDSFHVLKIKAIKLASNQSIAALIFDFAKITSLICLKK
jgi:hypothetical protein